MALDGRLIRSRNCAMGEIGYLNLPTGKFQDLASMTALVHQVQIALPSIQWNGQLVFEHATEPVIHNILTTYFATLAQGFRQILSIFAADQLIIGGGVAENPLFVSRLKHELKKQLPEYLRDTLTLMPAKHGNDAGVIGALCWHLDSTGK